MPYRRRAVAPVLLLLLAACGTACVSAVCTPAAPANPSFELPAGASGAATYAVTGWNVNASLAPVYYATGAPSYIVPIPDGVQCLGLSPTARIDQSFPHPTMDSTDTTCDASLTGNMYFVQFSAAAQPGSSSTTPQRLYLYSNSTATTLVAVVDVAPQYGDSSTWQRFRTRSYTLGDPTNNGDGTTIAPYTTGHTWSRLTVVAAPSTGTPAPPTATVFIDYFFVYDDQPAISLSSAYPDRSTTGTGVVVTNLGYTSAVALSTTSVPAGPIVPSAQLPGIGLWLPASIYSPNYNGGYVIDPTYAAALSNNAGYTLGLHVWFVTDQPLPARAAVGIQFIGQSASSSNGGGGQSMFYWSAAGGGQYFWCAFNNANDFMSPRTCMLLGTGPLVQWWSFSVCNIASGTSAIGNWAAASSYFRGYYNNPAIQSGHIQPAFEFGLCGGVPPVLQYASPNNVRVFTDGSILLEVDTVTASFPPDPATCAISFNACLTEAQQGPQPTTVGQSFSSSTARLSLDVYAASNCSGTPIARVTNALPLPGCSPALVLPSFSHACNMPTSDQKSAGTAVTYAMTLYTGTCNGIPHEVVVTDGQCSAISTFTDAATYGYQQLYVVPTCVSGATRAATAGALVWIALLIAMAWRAAM